MVAEHAGVSRATVSRVVNGASTVEPTIASRVLRSVEALNYVPNRAARTLASNRTGPSRWSSPNLRTRCSRIRSSARSCRASRRCSRTPTSR
ncbi:LacI family DNA-binding transcriptional regulator [Tessaracoccus coleopterorum]|uniref:LacI family DNA-binding transcriptional regulator n=1 Tax=Tessaracoccus coleopterorum TaxID=2714950 RepID=UPI0018D28BBC|nr:LacI family DNA-binding transcriptional regulator [Tessaracoccus coleopterorum]